MRAEPRWSSTNESGEHFHQGGRGFSYPFSLSPFSSYFRLELEGILGYGFSAKKLSSLPSGRLNHEIKHYRKVPFRVPLLLNQAARFNFGFASNMVLLLWCVCGGFLLHMLECNYFTILLKPNYEKPIDTAFDVLDMVSTILEFPGRESIVEELKDSPYYTTRALAELTDVAKVIILYYRKNLIFFKILIFN